MLDKNEPCESMMNIINIANTDKGISALYISPGVICEKLNSRSKNSLKINHLSDQTLNNRKTLKQFASGQTDKIVNVVLLSLPEASHIGNSDINRENALVISSGDRL
jgi:hypothetical protein